MTTEGCRETRPSGSLIVVLGDQLDPDAAAFDDFDRSTDSVWMAEVAEESTHVWSGKARTALFLAAMRHFAADLRLGGIALHYTRLDDPGNLGSLGEQLLADLKRLKPQRVVMTRPGDWRVLQAIRQTILDCDLQLDLREDRHFFTTPAEFAMHAKGRKSLRMEYFYREQRKRHRVLMQDDEPAGGHWNYDADNRASFGSAGPGEVPARRCFEPDAITREVIALVNTQFADHPGCLDNFAWPVTRAEALQSLDGFIRERLPLFGRYQDAMWPGDPWLYHSHLSAALNLKLLAPRELVAAAQKAWEEGRAPLESVEGFIRQILGWREYARGIYWTQMPQYLDRNALQADQDLPSWYWNGSTDMACLRDALKLTLTHGYANHIQRLMVTGLYALMLGVRPGQVHAWYLAVYVDAVEWVELPNTLGMSQYADGGVMGSKPYIATGKYIQRMSPHCKGCRYDPALASGGDACPFTTLYWDFLMRHESSLAKNPRMSLQVKNMMRLQPDQKRAIVDRAASIRRGEIGAAHG
jgi:deoxyribodipyrimidine photolyase-related protein